MISSKEEPRRQTADCDFVYRLQN